MNSNEREQLADELIGEAILFLLTENGPISTLSLIARLEAMRNSEQNNQRRIMLAQLIEEISHSHMTPDRSQDESEFTEWQRDSGDNVYPLFGGRLRQSRNK